MAIIILVRPQMGENIGSSARVMLNFGLHELRIVSPRDGWPNERAITMSAGAKSVIEQAQIFNNLADALHDCEFAFAATARLRDMNIAVHSPREAASLAQNKGRVALVFGAENNGLTNDEVAYCNALINIPTSDYASLNLAQSVGIVAYEWFLLQQHKPTEIAHMELATHASIHKLSEKVAKQIIVNHNDADNLPALQQNLLQLLLRLQPSPEEINFLHGLLKCKK
jgi:tRNA/rRNA methyltransferase